jgi:hypothetical protein
MMGACASPDEHFPATKTEARERAEQFAIRFRNNANHLAIAYGGPLYLVGSCLTSLTPGDIDLRLLLDRSDCVAMWGEHFDHGSVEWSAGKLARHREELKQSRRLTRRWRGGAGFDGIRRFDFQFQCGLFTDAEDRHPVMPDKPFLRLDSVPMHILLDAGRGEP